MSTEIKRAVVNGIEVRLEKSEGARCWFVITRWPDHEERTRRFCPENGATLAVAEKFFAERVAVLSRVPLSAEP